jgi:signal transduction histidine kinase
MDVAALHPPDQIDAYRSLLDRTIEDGTLEARTLADGSQIHLLTSEGKKIPVELHARTIDVEGASWIYTIARDITDRYQRERELEQQKDRFERFARVVSHDLRNPLNVANGRLALARDEYNSEHLEEVAQSLGRMEALIDDLLKLASEDDQEREWVDLAELSRTCWQNVETAETAITADTERTILADRSRLQQLFENLIRNAVEHGDAATVVVGGLDDGFYVEDDGPGIPPEERDRVFELGYSSSEEGSGFGLNIVEQVVDEHDWQIRVTDGTDGGVRFEITGVETR